MKKYQVFQINLRQLFGKDVPEDVQLRYFDIVHGGKSVNEEDFRLYRPVCNITARDLDQVFEIGNIGPEENIERLDRMHSISVGDIILDTETGEYSVVAQFGFETIQLEKVAA